MCSCWVRIVLKQTILCTLSLPLSYLKAESQKILDGFSLLGVSSQGTRSLIRSTQCSLTDTVPNETWFVYITLYKYLWLRFFFFLHTSFYNFPGTKHIIWYCCKFFLGQCFGSRLAVNYFYRRSKRRRKGFSLFSELLVIKAFYFCTYFAKFVSLLLIFAL